MSEIIPREQPVVQVKGLTKIYDTEGKRTIALHGLNFSVKREEICCIFGIEGAGKSALFHQLAGMESPTWGQILIGGVSVSDLNEEGMALFRQRHIGMIFPDSNLMPDLTVIENVALPLMFWGMARAERHRIAREMLAQAGLQDSVSCFPGHLPREMQRQVGIVRAFITRPDIILADEPIWNLDERQAKRILDLVRDFAKRYRQTVILLSENPEINRYGDQLLTLQKGELIRCKIRGTAADKM